MGIKLRTDVELMKRIASARNAGKIEHDAAVAHALVRAIDNAIEHVPNNVSGRVDCLMWIKQRAAEILRDDFGIDQE